MNKVGFPVSDRRHRVMFGNDREPLGQDVYQSAYLAAITTLLRISREFGKTIEWFLTGKDSTAGR
jgi:hypothetical protein